jgi:AcrR family transcriptional regulator
VATGAPRSTRPGGRTARVRAAVVAATFEELAEHGYDQLTVEGVAARSGVHKATIYRRWGGVDGLVADALRHAAREPWPVPDTGSLDGDLRGLAALVVDTFTDPHVGAMSMAAIRAASRSRVAADALAEFFAARHAQAAVVVTRAIDRGELPPQTEADEVIRATVAPLYYRLLLTREPVDHDVAVRAARAAARAARAGVFGPPSGDDRRGSRASGSSRAVRPPAERPT